MLSNIQHSSRNCHRIRKVMPSLARDLPRPLRIDSNQRGTQRASVRGLATLATASRQSTRAHNNCSKWQTTASDCISACLNEQHVRRKRWIHFVGCYMYYFRFLHTRCLLLYSRYLTKQKKTPWLLSASELYRPSDRRLSAKFVPTLADRGCRVVSATNPHGC
jgi:hypothetical protein